MLESLFIQWAADFKKIAKAIEERVNGKKTIATYSYKDMFTPELSTDLKWQSLNVDGGLVSADVVAMDSPLPLKRRGSFGTATGDIPKLGMKMKMSEKLMSDIDILKSKGVEASVLVAKIFEDTPRCIMGIHEKLEYIALQILSEGVSVIDMDNNTGLGVRIDLNYKDENKFGSEVEWSDVDAKPISDIQRVMQAAKANGDRPGYIRMSDSTFNTFSSNQQVKEFYGFSQNFSGQNVNIPSLNLEQANLVMQKNKLPTIIIVDRIVVNEKNGSRTVLTPWAENKVIFTSEVNVGKLFYGMLAEETRQNKAVTYAKSDTFILLKKWHENEPFAEFTSSQALVIPIPNNIGSIYQLDVEEAQQTEGQTEDDATITIYDDSTVTVANLVNALNDADVKSKPAATIEMTDVQLITLVNKLSNAKEEILKDILEIPVVNAGTDTTSSAATKALLGTATAAGDKTIASLLWSQVSGPNTAGFSAPTALSTNATGLITGTYVFKLTATDSEGTIASDTVSVVATVA
jgi:hypothetical protein